jgi:hypothetical protein
MWPVDVDARIAAPVFGEQRDAADDEPVDVRLLGSADNLKLMITHESRRY